MDEHRRDTGLTADESAVPAEWAVGDVILDAYKVKRIYEGGGMGLVYRVYHQGWNMDLAVKSPRPKHFQTEQQTQNFVRECETWINLGLYPHIVSCFYVRTLGGIPRVFAEYVEGGSLSDWIRTRKLYAGGPQEALKRILDVAIQMAWGLQYAHEQGVIHQDVKPANVLMTLDGTAKITDFGLSRARAATSETQLAHPSRSILVSSGGMTPAYCSPEQANGQSLTRRTDTWSWAVSLLEMFVGEVCWRSGPAAPHVLAEMTESAGCDRLVLDIPNDLRRLLKVCFATDPAERPAQPRELEDRLLHIYRSCVGGDYERRVPSAVELRADALNNRALSMREIGREEEAPAIWRDAMRLDPLHREAVFNRGLDQWRASEIMDDELLRRMEAICSARPDDWRSLRLLTQVHLERNDHDSAHAILARVQTRSPSDGELASLIRTATDQNGDTRRIGVLTGRTDWVSSVALSADGRFALSGSDGRTVKDHGVYLWDLLSGECLREMMGHSGGVKAVDLSSEGHLGLSGGEDGTVRLWDTLEGKCLRSFLGHTDVVSTVCLATGGQIVVSASGDQSVRVWDIADGSCRGVLKGHLGRIFAVRVAIDLDLVLSAGGTSTDGDFGIRLWRLSTGRHLQTLHGHTGGVEALSMTADGRMLLSCSRDRTLRLWDIATGKCIRVFSGHSWPINAACISPRAQFALSSDHSAILLWDVATGRCVRHLPTNIEGHARSIQIAAGGRLAVSGGFDRQLTVWQFASRDYRAPFAVSVITPETTASSDALRYAIEVARAREAMGGKQGVEALERLKSARSVPGYERAPEVIGLWQSLYTWLPRSTLHDAWEDARIDCGSREAFAALDITPDGCLAVSLGGWKDEKVRLWELSTRRCLRELPWEAGASVAIAPDGCTALIGGFSLCLIDIATGQSRRVEGHTEDVSAVAICPGSRFGIAGHYDGIAELWELGSARPYRILRGHKDNINAVCFNSDGRLALTASGDWANGPTDATVRIWDVATGSCVQTMAGHATAVMAICMSPDGQFVLCGCDDGTVLLRDLRTGGLVSTFGRHDGGVTAVCTTSDGRFALSGGDDGTIRFWDISNRRCVRVLRGHCDSVTSLRLSADGRMAVTGSKDGSMRLWILDWCLVAQHEMDWDERARPFLQTFLTLHTPYVADRSASGVNGQDDRIFPSRVHCGRPCWTDEDFQCLLQSLGCAGLGWLNPKGIQQELEQMARVWNEPPLLF